MTDQTTAPTGVVSSAEFGESWMAAAEQQAWLKEHMSLVEAFGFAARGMQAWLTTKDPSRDFVFPREKRRMEAAFDAVRSHAARLLSPNTEGQRRESAGP